MTKSFLAVDWGQKLVLSLKEAGDRIEVAVDNLFMGSAG